ncbi:MAG: restriction endonuclease subunit S [Proteobacteria bacterium]|nr:restriction endonuclease subunit S [Pseudomonadota bacterium]
MRSGYKRIGKYVKQVNARNKDLSVTTLQGVSINKEFMPSVANVHGTDMSKYKVVARKQFAFNPMHVGRDEVLPISMLEEVESVIVSPAYVVFEIKDENELLPEYLMMWCRRPEFDRNAWFTTDSSVRGGFSWNDFCEMELPVPSPEKQREIVKEYHTIVDRIRLNEQLNLKLEETAQVIYKQWFENWQEKGCETKALSELCELITDGKHGDCVNQTGSGYYFVSVKDINDGDIRYENARQITKKDFLETHKRTKFSAGDIVFTNTGTIGRMAIAKDMPETERTTFQKSVAILKPKSGVSKSCYLYCLLNSGLREIRELAGGTSQSNLLLGDFRMFEIQYPGFLSVCEFEKTVAPIFQSIHIKLESNKKLLVMREILLARISTMRTTQT